MSSWQEVLGREKAKPYFVELMSRVERARTEHTVFPPSQEVFNAFAMTPLEAVKVVIIGQDPYHGAGQAHGLSFSVQDGVKIPPSLRNIYKELATDIDGFTVPQHGNLTAWAKRGVLLLNTVLTVEQGNANSHAKFGWETFTDAVIEAVNCHTDGVVFLLWGSHAQKKGRNIDNQRHLVLTSPHPSPLSARKGFFGCQHFSQANTWLKQHHKAPINWQV